VTECHIAQYGPYPTDVEAGQTYHWCPCGRSKTQPFCDGSHKDTDFQPYAWTAVAQGIAYFCGCKSCKSVPLCDGSHECLR